MDAFINSVRQKKRRLNNIVPLNLRFPVKGLSSLKVAGFLVQDVEAVLGEASLNAVNPVTDSQV